MTQRTLSTVIFKVWGVTLLVSAVISLPNFFGIWLAPPWQPSSLPSGFSFAFYQGLGELVSLAAGILFIRMADVISARLFPADGSLSIAVDAPSLLGVILAAVGVAYAITALGRIAALLYAVVAKPAWDQVPTGEYLWSQKREAVITSSIELIVGLLLFVRYRDVVALWRRLRGQAAADVSAAVRDEGDENGAS